MSFSSILFLLFFIRSIAAVQVTYATAPAKDRKNCRQSTDNKASHVSLDTSRKTIVCCPNKGTSFETVDGGKEKEKVCCYALNSLVQSDSQLPCCPYSKRGEKGSAKTCVKRDLADVVVTFVADNGASCQSNKTRQLR